MSKVVTKVAVWFVIFIILLTLGLEMISAPNTIENVIGFFMVVAILYLSIRTKCLTIMRGDNIVTKGLLKVKNLLCKKV